MSFVENIHSFQNSTTSNTQTMNQVKDTGAVRSISAQAQELMPGKVFEGTVTDIKNGQVTIGLNDGRSISARMESGVNLQKGQPMLFEVKSVSGEQIAIIYCGTHGLMREVPVDKIRECQDTFLEKMRSAHAEVIATLASGKIDDDVTKVIESVMADTAGAYKS